ncbi:MAG TPA: BBE domain-containing protein [Sphingobium sp.]|nr:BBE domain-containing protein [Sphingobium sp.]
MSARNENADLFWALRGGGGNFGIVTDFELRTHELGPLQGGPLFYRMDDAVEVIQDLSALMKDAPREMSLTMALAIKPGMTPMASEFSEDDRLLMVNVVHRGGAEDEILRAVRSCKPALYDFVGDLDFLDLQRRLDQVSQHGVGWYMKSGHAKTLGSGLIEQMVTNSMEYQRIASPDVLREVYAIQSLGGAASDVAEEDTAYSGRDAQWHCAVEVGFMDQEERDKVVAWTKSTWAETEKHLDLKTSYVNMNFEEGKGALENVYGASKLERLRAVKAAYDPENFFRLNTNIQPVAS